MTNNHADALYNPNDNQTPRPNIADSLETNNPNSTTAAPSLQALYNPPRPRGEVGWICPICGRGNAPSTAYCNCNMTKPEIVYAKSGTSILDDVIPCHTEMNEYTTTAITSSSSANKGTIYGTHFDMHN
jgi:hypothetical protein